MGSKACHFLLLSFSFINTCVGLPGLHYHVPKKVVENHVKSTTSVRPVTTPAPEFDEAHKRRAILAAQVVTFVCDPAGTSCVAYNIESTALTTFNAQQLTATDGNWCFGPGCIRASNFSSSSTTTVPFNNGTDSTIATGPTGTGSSSNLSTSATGSLGNTITVGPPNPAPTAGTAGPSVNAISQAVSTSSNTTDAPTLSSDSTGFGTGTGGVSANPTLTDSSRGPFANSTGTSTSQNGPFGTGVSGEATSTTLFTNRTTISVTQFPSDNWAPWSSTAQPEEASTTTCTEETEPTDSPARAATASFKSTATLRFADTTYTVPVPASYTSNVPSPDDNKAEASSFIDAISASLYPETSSSPTFTAYPDDSPTSQVSNSATDSPTTFDDVSWSTEQCSTTTFYDRTTSGTWFSFFPTGSASICYGIACDAASSCHDWMSVYPFTDAGGNPITATASRTPPYTNASATASGIYAGRGTGSISYGGADFYPVQTGTGTVDAVATSEFTDDPWPSSPNATRNPAAYTNTAEVTGTPAGASADISTSITSISSVSVSVTILYTTFSTDGGQAVSPYTTIALDTSQTSSPNETGFNPTLVEPVATNDAAVLHPWVAWTATLDISTRTDDSTSADATRAPSDERDVSALHKNLFLDSKHKRAAVNAGRKLRKKRETEEGIRGR